MDETRLVKECKEKYIILKGIELANEKRKHALL
jgi:hypothetical protein